MASKALILKNGVTVQAGNAEIDSATIGYDSDTVYPEGSLPASMLRLVITNVEPDIATVKDNDLIVIIDE